MNRIILLLILLCISCSTPIAGGGTEGGNSDIFATAFSAEGTPAPGAEIILTERGALPSAERCKLSADSNGIVYFDTIPDGIYTLFGRSQDRREQLLHRNFIVKEGAISEDSLFLNSTAKVRVTIPESFAISDSGEIILDGTDLSQPFSTAERDSISGLWQVKFDTVPSGEIGQFLFWDGSEETREVSGQISIASGEELTIEEELVWSRSKGLNLSEGTIVYSMTLDSSGNIWVGTSVDGIFRFDGENWISESESGAITGIVWDMITLPDGTIVYCGDRGVFKREGELWVPFENMNLPEGSSPYALAYQKESDELLIGFNELGLMSWADGEIKTILNTTGWLTVFDIAIDSTGRVWAATDLGSYYRDEGWFHLTSEPQLPTFSVTAGGDGKVWFNHSTSLSFFFNEQWYEQVYHSMGQTFRITADKSGTLYSAGYDFISIYNHDKWLKYRSTNGEIGENGVFSVLLVNDTVYLGITDGVLSFTTVPL
jgi:hypothetical protein